MGNNITLLKTLVSGLLVILLSACASTPDPQTALKKAPNTLYCDSYFIYYMCAKDLTGNGEVDIMYFQDTREVFMAQAEQYETLPESYSPHRCMQVMDDSLQQASNAMLMLTDESSALQRTKVKTRMILNYGRYLTAINSCQDPDYVAQSNNNEDDFGSEDFEEL